ncbi:hypothetical protein CEXT_162531 [Caerostris extrusa]|uniref:Uncharacterized protein n=1 Tax=Caerostris extrusa TaxID=172846 RepID=A0AAV4M978_CAEEX|nr:hypothetical protein CEXT_162531 [Caerostris extrusa]
MFSLVVEHSSRQMAPTYSNTTTCVCVGYNHFDNSDRAEGKDGVKPVASSRKLTYFLCETGKKIGELIITIKRMNDMGRVGREQRGEREREDGI